MPLKIFFRYVRYGRAMRFLMTTNGGGPTPTEQLYEDMARLVEEMTKAGVLLAAGGLDLNGTHVVAEGGKITVTDGPYAETKETIVSFALVEVRSKEEVIELSRRFWQLVSDGEGDIRQVYGPGE
jgi:hypothetical protein